MSSIPNIEDIYGREEFSGGLEDSTMQHMKRVNVESISSRELEGTEKARRSNVCVRARLTPKHRSSAVRKAREASLFAN